MKKNKRYAFVVLNWNGKENTCLCLDSLDKIYYKEEFDIVVIDNGSTDGSSDYIKKHIKENVKRKVKFVLLPENTGFTGGHIEGLKHTDADVICLLNNDAVVAQNILIETDTIIKNLDGKFGAVGGRAHFWNESQKAYDVWNEFFTFQKIDPITAIAYTIKGDPGESLAPKVVDNVSGACVFVNRKAIDACGYLDNRFFAYYEETDMFARFKSCGFEVYYCPTIRYWHRFDPSSGSHGASTKHIKNFSESLITRNQFIFAFKNFEPLYLVRFLLWYYTRFITSFFSIVFRPASRNRNLIVLKTTISNLRRIPSLVLARRTLRKTLPKIIGYNSKIIQDEQRKTVVFIKIPNQKTLKFILDNTSDNDRVHLRRTKKCNENFKHRCMRLTADKSLMYGIAASSSRTDCIFVIESDEIKFNVLAREFAKIKPQLPYSKKLPGLFIFTRAFAFQLVGESLGLGVDTDWLQMPSTKPNRLLMVANKSFNKITAKPRKAIVLILDYLRFRKSQGGIQDSLRALIGVVKNLPLKSAHTIAVIRAGAHEYRLLKLRTLVKQDDTSMALSKTRIQDIPVFINCRDRVDSLKQTIDSVTKSGFKNIFLIDNQSSYPKLLEYYQSCPHQVILLGENMGHKAPWESLAVKLISGGRPYVVTDPDIELSRSYSPEVINKVLELFDMHPGYVKIGAGLAINDIPDFYEHKKTVQKWEQQFWDTPLKNSNGLVAFDAEIDTTFAVYRPNTGYITLPSIRLGGKHTAKHLPWYQDSKNPNDEEKYYRDHASSAVNTWNKDSLPEYLQDYIS